MEQLHYAGSSEIIGKTVINTVGNDYGTIKDIIFSSSQKKALAVIISTNSLFDKDYIAIPFPALRVNPNTMQVMVEIDAQTIQDAPPVNKELLQEGEEEELFRIFAYYGFGNVWKQQSKEAQPIHNWYQGGEDLGERHPENEGSFQETLDNPSGEDHNNISEEADYDKIKGLPKDNQ